MCVCDRMMTAESYRAKAAKFLAIAKREKVALLRAEYERLARSHTRLAEQVERNVKNFPSPRSVI